MVSKEIRKSFLDFFQRRGHVIVPSSSLIPTDDSSVLLTTAGMQQFKKYYTGELNALNTFRSQRVTSIQKCFRTSDIDSVGDESHLTFFEMLGNFSFGPVGSDNPEDFGVEGYFKKSAINWAYEYLSKELKIDPQRMKVSVFNGDEEVPFDKESYSILEELGFSPAQIIRGGREDNFWGPTGSEGPCGPTVEFYIDGLEVWNLVFNEYYKENLDFQTQNLRKLNNPGVDTGMGLERLAMILQGTSTIFETDLFRPLMRFLPDSLSEKTKRILVDHSRSIAFLISDGVRPSNKEVGYVLRRLMRRVMVSSWQSNSLNVKALLSEVVKLYKDIYQELDEKNILEEFNKEYEKFNRALKKGVEVIKKTTIIDAQEAFKIYETYGVPYEVIKDIGGDKAQFLTRESFEQEFIKHQEISRASKEKKFGGHGLKIETGEIETTDIRETQIIIRLHTATHLLQWALREILGKEVRQMGSDINPSRLRFDFSFDRKLTPQEIQAITDLVNQKIKENKSEY